MKNILITIMLSAVSAVSIHAIERPDTLIRISNANTATIVESPEGFALRVKCDSLDNKNDIVYTQTFDNPVKIESKRSITSLSLVKSNDNKWDLVMGGPGIGWVNACGQPSDLGIEMSKSLEISWLNVLAIERKLPWNGNYLSLGYGFDWRNYRISTSQIRFIPTDNSTVSTAPYPDGSTSQGSRLKVFSQSLTLTYHQMLPFKIFKSTSALSFGVIANLNTHGSLKTKWIDADGVKNEQKSNNIGQRKFTVDFIAGLRIWSLLNLYVRYSPQSVLKGPDQPHFTPLSSGIILGL